MARARPVAARRTCRRRRSAAAARAGIFATENGGQIVANGARTGENNYQIDGVGVTSVSWGGTTVITPNEDSIKEIKVVTNNYDAENGRYRGAQVQMISQNGTNQLHGSAFFKWDRPGLNAFQKYNGYGKAVQKNTARAQRHRRHRWRPHLSRTNSSASSRTKRSATHNRPIRSGLVPDAAVHGHRGSCRQRRREVSDVPGLVSSCRARCSWERATATRAGTSASSRASTATSSRDKAWMSGGRSTRSVPLGTRDPSFAGQLSPGLGGDGTAARPISTAFRTCSGWRLAIPPRARRQQYNVPRRLSSHVKDLLAFSMYRVPTSSDSFNGSTRRDERVPSHAGQRGRNHSLEPRLLGDAPERGARERGGLATGGIWRTTRTARGGCRRSTSRTSTAAARSAPSSRTIHLDFGIGAPGLFDQWTFGFKDTLTKVSRATR